jgi:hypothetical protein
MENMYEPYGATPQGQPPRPQEPTAPEPAVRADRTAPYRASDVPGTGRLASRKVRWAAGVGLAAVLVGGGAFAGASLAAGDSPARHVSSVNAGGRGGAMWRRGAVLAASLGRPGQAALGAALGIPGSPRAMGPAIWAGGAGPAGKPHGLAGLGGVGARLGTARAFGWLRRCIATARHLRAAGHVWAARARLRACLRLYLRMRFRMRLRLLLLGGLHGQITFRTREGIRTIAFERGVIQSVSATAVVVRSADGTTMTWHLIGRTVIVHAGHRFGVAALKAGARVLAVGRVVSGADDARLILIRR